MREKVDPAEIANLADRAVSELIQDSASGRILENRELAEVITGCIRDTSSDRLETLKWLLNQRSLEHQNVQH